jgi:serine/threonine protein kinase
MPEFDFGHFHILGELGRGGMALVYKAVDTRTNETIALKILYPHLMSDDNTIKRFQREARVATRLKHKYIVPVVSFGEHEDQIYIAMRYMAGDSLADLFAEPRAVKMKGIIRILKEVASALDYAHSQGVIHRDLKLQNILLDEQRHAYLSDFGIARLVDGTRLTATGQIAGTPMYMSPEQIRGKPVDFHSDIYSFSVMAYLLLTGYYPFTGEDSLSIIHKHVKEFPPVPTDVNDDLPEAVNGVLLRGLMKDPKDRFDTTIEMVKALNHAVNTPEMIKTTTRIDIRAVNPVDSVEMDAVSTDADPRIQSATGGAVSQVVSSQSQAALLQSDLSSAVITGQPTLQSTGDRKGIFGPVFIMFGIAAIVIPILILIFLAFQGGDRNNSIRVTLTPTRTELEVEQELTIEALSVINEDDEDDDDDAYTEQPNDTAPPPTTLPPTWTPTPTVTVTATITPTVMATEDTSFPGSNGVVASPNGAVIQTEPGPRGQLITTLPNGTHVQIIGKTGLDDYYDVVTEDGIQGYVNVSQIDTEVDIDTLTVTFFPLTPPPPKPNSGG